MLSKVELFCNRRLVEGDCYRDVRVERVAYADLVTMKTTRYEGYSLFSVDHNHPIVSGLAIHSIAACKSYCPCSLFSA